MRASYLTCGPCRIRIRANAPQIDLSDDMCPTCGAQLQPAARVASVLGLRSFDWFADSSGELPEPLGPPTPPADLRAHRERAGTTVGDEPATAVETADAERWSNDGGRPSAAAEAVAPWPASR